MPARSGPRPTIETLDLLAAVDQYGIYWTAAFAGEEIVVINEALDRELLAGTLANAYTVSPGGDQLLDLAGNRGPRFQIARRLGCHEHADTNGDCHTVVCTRCRHVVAEHVTDLSAAIAAGVTDHVCVPAGRTGGAESIRLSA